MMVSVQVRRGIFLLSTIVSLAAALPIFAQAAKGLTSDQDRQLMMDKLGIKVLRPGPSGDEKAPNHANYDQAKANPYPDYPDALKLDDGQPVTTSDQWWTRRRPQIVEAYEREVYGRVPDKVPAVRWTVVATDREQLSATGLPVLARRVIGHVDNAAYPGVSVDMRMMVVTPAAAKGPVPLLLMLTATQYSGDKFPMPSQPSASEFEQLNTALKASISQGNAGAAAILKAHPGFDLLTPAAPKWPEANADGDPASIQQLIAAGWGFATLDTSTIQEDNGEGLARGVIGLVNKGRPRSPTDWGALRAWAWGASRAFDYLRTDPTVDGRRIGVEGVSRYGKAALVAMAFDQRFAVVLVGSSGKGGATPLRRFFGEDVSSLATGAHYWMAGNFLKYDGALTPRDIPVDANELIALCAPRPTFISYGVPEKGDANWLDHRGSYMATVASSPVFTLLGARGLQGALADYHAAQMPPVNTALLAGDLAWRQHDGGHTDAPNMKWFLQWAAPRLRPTP
jgi:hypothetical protein